MAKTQTTQTTQTGETTDERKELRQVINHVFRARQHLQEAANNMGKKSSHEHEVAALCRRIEELDDKLRAEYADLMRPRVLARREGESGGVSAPSDRSGRVYAQPELGPAVLHYEACKELLTDAQRLRGQADHEIEAAREKLFEARARVLDLCSARGIVVARVEDVYSVEF
jgi:hypothetical protein